jgi:hypothetical protein
VGRGVADDGQLDEPPAQVALRVLAEDVVPGGVAAVQAGGVDRRLRLVLDQAAFVRAEEEVPLEALEPTFFSSRGAA